MVETSGTELGKFLRARRTRIKPEDVGLPSGVGVRRTPGLRREELATLAGMSIDYYTRLERGKETRPSAAVIDSLAHALLLDEEEHAYLRELTSLAARRAPEPRRMPARGVRPTVKRLLEMVRPAPAYVVGRTNDVLAANPAGTVLLAGMADWPAKQHNTIRYTFLHPAARTLWPDWEQKALACVAHLRAVAGSDPDAPDLAAIVGELMVKSAEFSRIWEMYHVRRVKAGSKMFHHPVVGDMTLNYEVLPLTDTDGQRMVIYQADPGTPDYDAMVLLELSADRAESSSADAKASEFR